MRPQFLIGPLSPILSLLFTGLPLFSLPFIGGFIYLPRTPFIINQPNFPAAQAAFFRARAFSTTTWGAGPRM